MDFGFPKRFFKISIEGRIGLQTDTSYIERVATWISTVTAGWPKDIAMKPKECKNNTRVMDWNPEVDGSSSCY